MIVGIDISENVYNHFKNRHLLRENPVDNFNNPDVDNHVSTLKTETIMQAINACIEIVLITDFSGKILFANESARQRYFSGSETIIGSQIWDVLSIQQQRRLKMIVEQIKISKQDQLITFKDSNRWLETKISFLSDDEGDLEYLFFSAHDITRQKNAEEQLKKKTFELATAQEDERHRISRDLHDEIGQRMTALLLQLRSIKEVVIKENKIEPEFINSAARNLENIIKHLRQIFYQLYPPSLSKVSLPKVLEALCSSVEDANGIRIDFSCQEGIPDLLDSQVTTIYRFVQEGLTNVVKHAKAESVWVNLDYSDGDINISIEDDGIGFDANTNTEGVGFRGIRDRFMILNGCFEIETAPDKGTRLSGSIPIRKKSMTK